MEQQFQNFPPPISEKQEIQRVDYVGRTTIIQKKYLIILILFFLVALGVGLFKIFNKNAENIKIDGSRVDMTLGKQHVVAEMAPKSTESFLLNGGIVLSPNLANFGAIPMEKVKYLEQKYTDFIHCGSPGEEEGKSSLIQINFIAANSETEKEIETVMGLVEKGNIVVIEITGSKLNILENSYSGYKVIAPEEPNTYYLVDTIRIIKEKYQ